MQISTPLSSTLKCPTCRVDFTDEQVHKQHYKSDFHRYNLKRSMVNLPPATLQQFSTKRSQQKPQNQTTFQCGQCRKTFSSVQTLNQHKQTKKHDINKAVPQKQQRLIEQRPKVYVKNEKRCLFCLSEHKSIEENLQHMKLAHSFFIAEEKYCTDKAKLLLYLQEKIEVGMMCILCENKGAKDFTTGDSVKQHMLSKNHTFMKTEGGFEEYEDFYDFSELFKQKLEEQKLYATPVGINFEKVKVIVDDKDAKAKPQKKGNEDQMQAQEEWEDDSDEQQGEQQWEDESSSQGNEAIQQQTGDNQQEIQQKKRRRIRTYDIMMPTLTSTEQLLLPNGKTLGHRKYRHIYRQAVKLQNWFQSNNKNMLESGASQHALILRNNLLELIKKERIMKSANREQDKKWVKKGIQNSNLFRHFRSSNPL